MHIYISLPITGKNESEQRRKAIMWQNYLESKGHIISNPFDIFDRLINLNPNPSYRAIMQDDLAELITCDAIFLCNGWEESKGCLEEVELAIQQKLKVMFEKHFQID